MATKDWKKTKGGWYNNTSTIDIGKGISLKTGKVKFVNNRYVLNIHKNHRLILNKQFKTKALALTYAKNYMRKN